MKKQDNFDEKDLTDWVTYDPNDNNLHLVATAPKNPSFLVVKYTTDEINWTEFGRINLKKLPKGTKPISFFMTIE